MGTVIVLGSGGAARETYWLINDLRPQDNVVFADNTASDDVARVGDLSIPIVRNWRFDDAIAPNLVGFCVAVEAPRAKKLLVETALAAGLKPAPPLVCPTTIQRPDARVGVGTVCHARSIINTNVVIGDFVILMPMTAIAHDANVGDYTTCEQLSSIAGYVQLGEGVHAGQGCSVRERGRVAPWVTIAMQSCVAAPIDEANITVQGVPARKVVDG